jgi:hypothetical protein
MALPHFSCEEHDLSQSPKPEENKADGCQDHVLGDLHSNYMKFIHFLIRKNILSFNHEDDYEKLYKEDRTAYFIKRFAENAQINQERLLKNKIILIGDELADRGKDDTLILFIILSMGFSNNVMDILLSNHGLEFLKWYEAEKKGRANIVRKFLNAFTAEFFPPSTLSHVYKLSLITLQNHLENDPDLWDVIEELVETFYKPCLKLFSYSLNKDADGKSIITLYAHADFGLNQIERSSEQKIEGVVEFFNKSRPPNEPPIIFDDSTAEALAKTIDDINHVFQTRYVKPDRVSSLIPNIDDNINPINNLIWSRKHGPTHLNQPHEHKGYKIFYGSGHDTPKSDQPPLEPHVYCLDNLFGKGSEQDKAKSPELIVPTSRKPHLKLDRLSSKPKAKTFFSRLKTKFNDFTEHYPKTWWAIKWIGIPVAIASAVVLSGGLAAIPGGVGAAMLTWTSSLTTATIIDIALITIGLDTLQLGYHALKYLADEEDKKRLFLSKVIKTSKVEILTGQVIPPKIAHISQLLPSPPSLTEEKTIAPSTSPATSEYTQVPRTGESAITPQKTEEVDKQCLTDPEEHPECRTQNPSQRPTPSASPN